MADTWTPLDETRVETETGHLSDHNVLHDSWNAAHVREITGSTTLDENYTAVIANTNAGPLAVTLPATTGYDGHIYVIKRYGGSVVTINRTGGDTFDDGATTKTLGSNGATISFGSIGTSIWFVFGERGTVT